MRHKPIPWAIALTGVLYFGLLIYWQSDELSSEIAAQRNAAQFGLVLSVIYVAYLMWCFNRDLPEGLKDAPVIGRYGKLLGWLAIAGVAGGVTAGWCSSPTLRTCCSPLTCEPS